MSDAELVGLVDVLDVNQERLNDVSAMVTMTPGLLDPNHLVSFLANGDARFDCISPGSRIYWIRIYVADQVIDCAMSPEMANGGEVKILF